MIIYQFLETGDRRTTLYKQLASQYEALCTKDGSRYMETEKAQQFANKQLSDIDISIKPHSNANNRHTGKRMA